MEQELWVPNCSCDPPCEWVCMRHEKEKCQECYEGGFTIMGRTPKN